MIFLEKPLVKLPKSIQLCVTVNYIWLQQVIGFLYKFQVVQKEKRRADDEKSQVAALKREIQSLSESCDDVEQKRQKLATEVHTKETHINAISGQLAHLKKSLDQETSKVWVLGPFWVYRH